MIAASLDNGIAVAAQRDKLELVFDTAREVWGDA